MKKSTVLTLMALSALVYSCKKDDDKSTSEKLLGKWTLVNQIENHFYNNLDHKDTATYPAGYSSVEFLNNGTFIEKYNGSADTSAYKLDGSNLIVNNTDTVKINAVSGSDLQVYSKDAISASNYYEYISNYKK